ncbi:transposase [Sporosarcina sp. 179-K 3D1 HS]|uniref:transposase n=1 Tax=Sporosarcina sp. 179-K 3D1 HS TaxID=3232169 RepID=UPI0039A09E20
MARKRRAWHPKGYYHIIVRGNNRQNIFRNHEDVNEYFRVMDFVNGKFPFELYAYCIMTNHAHLLLRSPIVPLGKLMAPLNRRYSDYCRKRHGYVGQIYQNRYFSKEVIDATGLLQVSSYIHRNPIETKQPMVRSMELYPHSSYKYYFHERQSPYPYLIINLLPSLLPPGWERTPQGYAKYCRESRAGN